MKYANRLTDDDLMELYKIFAGDGAEIVSLDITRSKNGIALEGFIKIPDDEEGSEDGMIEVDDDYEITDFDVRIYHHSGNLTKEYRTFMYKRFGNEYAKDYLLG